MTAEAASITTRKQSSPTKRFTVMEATKSIAAPIRAIDPPSPFFEPTQTF